MAQSRVLDITLPANKVIINTKDAFDNPIPNIDISTNSPFNRQLVLGNNLTASGGSSYGTGFNTPKPKTDSTGKVTLWLFPTAATPYTFTAIPPSGSIFGTTTLPNISVINDSEETIVMPKPVTLNGHIFDPLSNPVSNQTVYLQSSGNVKTTTTTDNSGSYSLQVTAGNYLLVVQSPINNNAFSLNVPQAYHFVIGNYSIANSTVFDMTIPAKKVDVHVQDITGNPVKNIEIKTDQPTNSNLSIGSNVIASGIASYGVGNVQGPKTDVSGNTTLWLYPTANTPYSLTATPPSGSIYSPFTLNNISVTGDQTELISLQYNHSTPVTTADLATQHPDETYSNPTTVTLTASAAAGYAVENTYYKIDGGAQQTYTTPFTVTGNGDHAIIYWSVDNTGVQELHNSKIFTIYTNQPPHVNPLANATINQGQIYTANDSFTDPDSASWSAMVNYGDGSGEQTLPLTNQTFTLNHQYTTVGVYTVVIVVRDSQQNTGTTTATVTVNALPTPTATPTPTVTPIITPTALAPQADTYIKALTPNQNEGASPFLRIQALGNNRALIKFDQTQIQQAIGTSQNYTATLQFIITDNGNNWGRKGGAIAVQRLTKNWLEGNGYNAENPHPNRGTGSGTTWHCSIDTNIANFNDDCNGTTAWDMDNSNHYPFVSTPTATTTIINNQMGVVTLNVTADIKSFINGTKQNYGWIIKKGDEDQFGHIEFGSKESSSSPRLVIVKN